MLSKGVLVAKNMVRVSQRNNAVHVDHGVKTAPDQQLVFFTNHLSHLPFSIDLSLLLPTSYYRPAGQKSVHRPAKFFQADLAVIIDIQDRHLVVLRQVGSEVLATVDAGQAMDDAGMANQQDPL